MTVEERLAILEAEFRLHRERSESEMENVNSKLDKVLELKAKGQGAFWLATTIFGASFAAFLTYLMTWFK